MSLKELVRVSASRAVVATGIAAAGRAITRKSGAVIFCGHRVTDNSEGYLEGLAPRDLTDQIRYLTRHYEPLSLDRLVECFERIEKVPAGSFVVTFDDGFKDNLTTALPILEREHVPFTVFVSTGCVDSGELPWSQRLGFMLQHTTLCNVSVVFGNSISYDLSSAVARAQAHLEIKSRMRNLGRDHRERILQRLQRDLDVEPPSDRMLRWRDLRELQDHGAAIGAHTVSHALLACIGEDEARSELVTSRDALRDRLGIARPFFAFPGGSYSQALVELVHALGFRSCFQSDFRRRVNNLKNSSAFTLSRMGLPNRPAFVLEAELDGPWLPMRRVYRRLLEIGSVARGDN